MQKQPFSVGGMGGGVAKKFEDWGITDLRRRVGTFAGGRRGRVSTPLHAMLS